MSTDHEADARVSRIATAVGEPARARILYCLMGNRARTSTELALVADVSPSTASAHLTRLVTDGLVRVRRQGRYRYYSLRSADVASLLEGLAVFASAARGAPSPRTPAPLRAARTCYDHIAGRLGVALHERLTARGWLTAASAERSDALELTGEGAAALERLGVDVTAARRLRRRFAYECLDWSERRPHLGGALGAALLALAVERRWVAPARDGRALRVTPDGRRALAARLGLRDEDLAPAAGA